MSGHEGHVQLPAELETQLRDLESTCEARYVRPASGDRPRRYALCRNPADYAVTLTNPCGHAIAEPMCATHHDMVDAYWCSARMVVVCAGCAVKAQPVDMRCELL